MPHRLQCAHSSEVERPFDVRKALVRFQVGAPDVSLVKLDITRVYETRISGPNPEGDADCPRRLIGYGAWLRTKTNESSSLSEGTTRSRHLTDRVLAYEASCEGAIPSGGTTLRRQVQRHPSLGCT